MSDGSMPATEWGRWLKRMTTRPGWSVAELARRTKELFGDKGAVGRATLFEYIKIGGESVSIGTIRKLATAAGDDFLTALLAAGNISVNSQDAQIATIITSDLDPDEQADLIEYVETVREAQREAMKKEIEARLSRPRRSA
jgi:transcriptional regulator with XRE-family HTH domain